MGGTAGLYAIASGILYAVSNEGDFDTYQFVVHMIVWPQNFAVWIAVLLEPLEIMREIYFFSSVVAAIGPYALYHIYTAWLIIDAIVAPYGTYTIGRDVGKILGFILYTVLAIFLITQLIPGLYNYWVDAWLVNYIAKSRAEASLNGDES